MCCAQERAEKLLGGLGGEQRRWTAAAAQLRADAKRVVGDALLSAAAMAYLRPFTPTFRRALVPLGRHESRPLRPAAHALLCINLCMAEKAIPCYATGLRQEAYCVIVVQVRPFMPSTAALHHSPNVTD